MERTVVVKGVGTASVKPDLIEISMRVSSVYEEYNAAVEAANKRIAMLQNAVVKSGFAKEELKTLSFDVSAGYDNVPDERGVYRRAFAGYRCAYDLKLSFDMDAGRLAETLTAISGSGADAELSIRFTVKDPESVSAQILKSATENARQKAEILCAASGVKLGALLRIDYDWADVNIVSESKYSMVERGISAAGAVPEFVPEDIRSRDSAAFIWEIM